MYQVGDQVIYGVHGVCRIQEIQVQRVDHKRVEYYVLVPRDQADARFFVPTHNPAAVAKLRPMLTPQELEALLESPQARADSWIEDENQRKQRYRELISSGERWELVSMIRSLLRHKERQAAQGRKFHLCDENFLRDAKKLLTSEFSLILDMDQEQVERYVHDALNRE